ncbi:MAG: hypothetical protein GY811_10150 [Myxococcales bacterium]|nr:hypothetical protein [Myxococcales bacterium]
MNAPTRTPSSSLRIAACAVGFVGLLTTGCGKKDAADCGAASGHVISLVRAELAKDSDADRAKTARANLPTLQNAILKACESEKWSPRVRKCITSAKAPAETKECAPGLQTPAAESAAPAEQSR